MYKALPRAQGVLQLQENLGGLQRRYFVRYSKSNSPRFLISFIEIPPSINYDEEAVP